MTALYQHSTATTSSFNTASSETLGESRLYKFVFLYKTATAQQQYKHNTITAVFIESYLYNTVTASAQTATALCLNTASSEDLGEEQALLNLVVTTQPLYKHKPQHQCPILQVLRTYGKSKRVI